VLSEVPASKVASAEIGRGEVGSVGNGWWSDRISRCAIHRKTEDRELAELLEDSKESRH
jgi:hypothetical protein